MCVTVSSLRFIRLNSAATAWVLLDKAAALLGSTLLKWVAN